MNTNSFFPKSIPGFTISGTNIIDANGQTFMMRGVNHAHTWYKNDIESAISSIALTSANVVRIVLSNGKKWIKDEPDSVRNIISLCESKKLISVLEVHDAIGSNDQQDLENTIIYWKELFNILTGKEDRVIINIANEWFGTWDSAGWAEGYKIVIPELRQAGFEHLFVVDTAGYGQYPQAIFDKGREIFQSDSLSRTLFSIHMYEYAGANAKVVKENIDKSLEIGIPVIIGEFGDNKPEEQSTDVYTIMNYSQERAVGWMAWSWYGNTNSVLDLTSGPSGNFSLTNWGRIAIENENGIRNTSIPCSIFN